MADYFLKRLTDNQEFNLGLGSALVGRSESCDVRVLGGQASREHARIRLEGERLFLEDLHSTNGTFVNDKRIQATTEVKPGDVLRFDQESFSLHSSGQANQTIYGRPVSAKAMAMSIEEQDEEDVNATAYRQAFVMPPGWQNFGDDQPGDNDDDRKQQALNNFINKAFLKLTGQHLIALVFSKGDEPPAIKTVSAETEEQRWSIGRNNTCDIVIATQEVSDIHAYLCFSRGEWSLEDNKSTNGIWVKNKRQSQVTLSNAQQLHLASLTLDVRIESRD